MNKFDSKYFNTSILMDEAILEILEKKDLEYITVKEVCAKAQVNRSTFYLHYNSINDLVLECSEYVTDKFLNYINSNIDKTIEQSSIITADINDLYLIDSKYLIPYLTFIKDNKRFYKTVLKNSYSLRLDKTYNELFKNIFDPILKRFNVLDYKKKYIMNFYIHGILSVISTWLDDDCTLDINSVIDIIKTCINK